MKYILMKEGLQMDASITIRMATMADAAKLLAIYAPYVENTAITFEYDVPTVEEFSQRMRSVMRKYPYLVALEEDRIVGYAYASAFRERAAYDWCVETSIYLDRDCRGKGLGKKLYCALEDILRRQNILNLNACISYTPVEDAHLTNASVSFHEHLGYTKVAHFTKCGYKFGAWYDMIWMEKILGPHPGIPAPIVPVADIRL